MTAKQFSSHGFVTNLTDMEKSLSLSGGDFLCQCTIGNLAWFIKVETNEDYFSKECATNVSYRGFIQWFHAISFLRWYVEMI